MAQIQPRKLADFGELTKAEQQVLDELDTGEVIQLGDGETKGRLPPEDAGPERQLRARFLRWLALGGDDDHRLYEKGLRVVGALITSDGPVGEETAGLDLEGCEIARDLMFFFCRFADPPLLRSARLQGLHLDGSVMPGLVGDGLEARGGVYLRGTEVSGEIRLLSAQIARNLEFDDAKILNEDGMALSADRLHTRGGVFLRGAEVTGEVRLLGARIDGDLDCNGTKICNTDGKSLNASGAKVAGGFFLRYDAKIGGLLDLSGAELGAIVDDPVCWPEKTGDLLLERCRYGAFTGYGVSAAERIRWLALQDPAKHSRNFLPSAYEQCAKVFREMGHLADAKDILIEKEKLQRADRLKRIGIPAVKAALWLWDGFLAWTVCYGQKPLFAVRWLGGLWAIGVLAFWLTWQADAFKPNNAFVLRADEWVGCSVNAKPYAFRKDTATASQLGCYLAQPEAEGFPEFNVWVYTLDVLFPLVQLEQQVHWVPDEDIRPVGRFAKGLVYVEIVMGWLLSLLAVAGLSGIIKSD